MNTEELRELWRTARCYAEAGVNMQVDPRAILRLIEAYERTQQSQ